MKIAVRYQSHGGNTKAVTEIIAKAAGVTAESIEKPIDETVDVLFIGGGVYYRNIDPSLKTFLENLNPELVKSIAAFHNHGLFGGRGYIKLTEKQICLINEFVNKIIKDRTAP
jgi:flavodoxin